MYGHSPVTQTEREEYDRFILAKTFGIKPWEVDPEGEKYPEDLNSLIAFSRLWNEAMKKSASEQEARAAFSSPRGR